MKIISGLKDFKLEEPSAIAIGKFDGVHIGHRMLLDYILKQKQNGLQAVVFTFDKAPAALFSKTDMPYLEIHTLQEKRAMFESLGVDLLIEFPLTYETASITAEEFVTKILKEQMQASYIVAGEDVHFGHKGLGNSSILKNLGETLGFSVEIVKKRLVEIPNEYEHKVVSSTLVRTMIERGEMENVSSLLGTNFSLQGQVEYGKQLGAKVLDMPTANVVWPENKIKPPFGVYFSQTRIGEMCYHSITNVGVKPTVTSDKRVLAETYIYDFTDNIYGEWIEVELLSFYREEKKFHGLDELKEHMKLDMHRGLVYANAEK